MAERWQQWMPFHIDQFRGSPDVRAMHPAAQMGYLYLLASAWQTEDCTISADPLDLASDSCLGDELWEQYKTRILRKFEEVGGGRLRNQVLHEKWLEAKRVFDARVAAAKKTTNERSPRKKSTVTVNKSDGHRKHTDTVTPRPADTITGTETSTGTRTKKQKHSRAEAAEDVDPRHSLFKAEFMAYFEKANGIKADWSAWEGTSLKKYLTTTPLMTVDHWKRILENRARSDVAHGEALSAWIKRAKTFYLNPLDRFGKPIGGSNGRQSTFEENIAIKQEVLDERAGRMADGEDHDGRTIEARGTGTKQDGFGDAA